MKTTMLEKVTKGKTPSGKPLFTLHLVGLEGQRFTLDLRKKSAERLCLGLLKLAVAS
jgi:hypothetical protein